MSGGHMVISGVEFSTVADHLAASMEIIERNLNRSHNSEVLTERLKILRFKILGAQAWLNYLYK